MTLENKRHDLPAENVPEGLRFHSGLRRSPDFRGLAAKGKPAGAVNLNSIGVAVFVAVAVIAAGGVNPRLDRKICLRRRRTVVAGGGERQTYRELSVHASEAQSLLTT